MQKGCFYGKFYFTMDKWNEEKILKSPFSWILKLTEEEYVSKINTVYNKYQLKKQDQRFSVLQSTGLFNDEVIKKFLKNKDEQQLDGIINPKPKLSPW